MTKIRLTRLGDKQSPFYRVIVTDSHHARESRVIETLGTYDPLKNPAEIKIDAEKTKKWLSTGAQPTETVRYLLISAGVIPAPEKRPPAKTPKKKEGKS
jgi:small subunit ribosomal protein S16